MWLAIFYEHGKSVRIILRIMWLAVCQDCGMFGEERNVREKGNLLCMYTNIIRKDDMGKINFFYEGLVLW